MTHHLALQQSALFKHLPEEAKRSILSKPSIDEACAELQVQLDLYYASIHHLIKQSETSGDDIDALGLIGKQGCDPFELDEATYQQLVEIDPARYHPSSLRPTTRAKAVFNNFLSNL